MPVTGFCCKFSTDYSWNLKTKNKTKQKSSQSLCVILEGETNIVNPSEVTRTASVLIYAICTAF